MSTEPTHPIPTNYVEFAEKVAILAKEYEFGNVTLTVRPGFRDEWRSMVTMTWQQGRHGDESHRMHLSSTIDVRHTLPPMQKPPGRLVFP